MRLPPNLAIQLGFFFGGLFCAIVLHAQDTVTVSDCPGKLLPVQFEVDCSHVADSALKQECPTFARNQACRVFFAYRDITGINLEQSCPVFKYEIYDENQWPHPKGEGGLAGHCGADILSDVALKIDSPIGTYDVHEILHVYQAELGAIPQAHILFGPSMAEARKRIGDNKGYWNAMTQMKQELARNKAALDKQPGVSDSACIAAEVYTENNIYVSNPAAVMAFYRKLELGRARDMNDRFRRFNRMYDLVSEGKAKPFLLNYCPAF
jgi:hypothetical protein